MDASPLVPKFERVMPERLDSRLVPSVVLNGHGKFNRISVINAPLPRYIKDDHVEVQVYYCGLNFTDNYLRLGIIRSEVFPIIMGSECCGIVTRVGDNVNDLEVGQRVVCLRMHGGLFRRVVQVPRANVFPLPPTIDLKVAMALALDGLVAYLCLFELDDIRNAIVFMESIAGGVGTLVAQLGRTMALTVLGTASEDKHDGLLQLGVSRVYRHQDNYAERILRLHPQGADIAIVRSGGDVTAECLRLLKPCGRLVTIGSDSTATYPRTVTTVGLLRPTWDTRYLSSAELINKNIMVGGLNIGDLIEIYPYDVQRILDNMFELHLQEQIKPQIHSILPFEKMAEGLELLCKRQNFGKVLLELRDEAELASRVDQLVPSPPKRFCRESPQEGQDAGVPDAVKDKGEDGGPLGETSRGGQTRQKRNSPTPMKAAKTISTRRSEVEADTAAEMTTASTESEAEHL